MPRPTSALIVDDEAHVRTYLRLLLRELGVAATWEAGDGATAVQVAVEHRPGFILLDVNMPVMGGLDALTRLQELAPDIPVIVVTTQSAMSTVQEAVRRGAAGYVLKQSPKNELLQMLRDEIDAFETPETGENEERAAD